MPHLCDAATRKWPNSRSALRSDGLARRPVLRPPRQPQRANPFVQIRPLHAERPFFAFPAEVRTVIYTTNAVESLNMSLRKALKTRGAFPSEEAALKRYETGR